MGEQACCECGHAQTGHAFSDDVCAVPECPCDRYRAAQDTPGQAAYEAFQRAFPNEDWGPWDRLGDIDDLSGDKSRAGWEAVAQAAIKSAQPQEAVRRG